MPLQRGVEKSVDRENSLRNTVELDLSNLSERIMPRRGFLIIRRRLIKLQISSVYQYVTNGDDAEG